MMSNHGVYSMELMQFSSLASSDIFTSTHLRRGVSMIVSALEFLKIIQICQYGCLLSASMDVGVRVSIEDLAIESVHRGFG